jgi:hypothetical protein
LAGAEFIAIVGAGPTCKRWEDSPLMKCSGASWNPLNRILSRSSGAKHVPLRRSPLGVCWVVQRRRTRGNRSLARRLLVTRSASPRPDRQRSRLSIDQHRCKELDPSSSIAMANPLARHGRR